MSYNTLAEVQAVDADITQAMLDDATLYIDARYGPLWPGEIASTTQPENWPRVGADGSALLDVDGRVLLGIPDAVKRAELEAVKLIKSGNSLLATTVATASSSQAGGQLTQDEIQVGPIKILQKYSTSIDETSSSSSQTIDENGYPVVKLIDAILAPITSLRTVTNDNNYYLLRA